ncbi:uncharacterized protein LOC141854234 [Brevipalpus obovatus]|uniref:uncharacterized protein LOC141854234 n=1 Tax=Brevipalpus obovatus TaxID=246614 RepID=UPI003D9DD655
MCSFYVFIFILFTLTIASEAKPGLDGPDEVCGCDEENREMMQQFQEKLMHMSSPHHLVKQRAADLGFDMVMRDGHSPVHTHSDGPRHPSAVSAHALQQREAKVNEYFYKSDVGHMINPYTFRGKDGRIYTNYRPDNGVPVEHMASAGSGQHHHFVAPPPIQPVHHPRYLMRRETRSLNADQMPSANHQDSQSSHPFIKKIFNPQAPWNPLKRNDPEISGSDYGYGHAYSMPRAHPHTMWPAYQGPEWAASNVAPVSGRMHPHYHSMAPMNPSPVMMTRVNPMESPMNMNGWYNFLNQPYYGPMAGPAFPVDNPQSESQTSSSAENNKMSGNNSSEESSEKKTPNRQRSRWQINFSRIPITNLRNLFRINPTTTSTTETPSELM